MRIASFAVLYRYTTQRIRKSQDSRPLPFPGRQGEDSVMKRAAYHNLGCKVNSYELDVMRQILEADGYETVPFEEEADLYIINTCSVTNIADRKSRQMLHRAKKMNPDALVVAVGCYVETDPDRVEQDPAIDLAIGNNRKGEILDLIRARLEGREERTIYRDETLAARPEYEDMQLAAPGHTRAYIKIQDGCNQFCSYCIIPFARGRIRSRRPGEILREAAALAGRGIREIVLTGIHVSSYGLEWGVEGPVPFDPVKSGNALLDLLRRLSGVPGICRIRLSSLEPRIMTEDFVRGLAEIPEVCPHFHLSLQSGCDATLRRMNRHYTTKEYKEIVERIRRHMAEPAMTTDVICGFPGETEEEFLETRRFLEDISFYMIHVFRYSVRRGTVAEKLKGQVRERVKADRSAVLLDMTRDQAGAYRESFIGRREELLIEETRTLNGRTWYTGHTARYVEGAAEAAGGLSLRPGSLVRGRFAGFIPGTDVLRMET